MNNLVTNIEYTHKKEFDILDTEFKSFKKEIKTDISETKNHTKEISEHVMKIRERVFDGLTSSVKDNKSNIEKLTDMIDTKFTKINELFLTHIKDHEAGAERAKKENTINNRWLKGIAFSIIITAIGWFLRSKGIF